MIGYVPDNWPNKEPDDPEPWLNRGICTAGFQVTETIMNRKSLPQIIITDFNSLFMPIGAAKTARVCPMRHAERIIYSTPAIKV